MSASHYTSISIPVTPFCGHSFEYVPDARFPSDHVSVAVTTQAEQLDDILSAFNSYLLACGFVLGERERVGIVESEGFLAREEGVELPERESGWKS